MEQEQRCGRRRRIVLLPFLARGHLIPFLKLAKLIERQYPGCFTVTLVSTPLNVLILRQSLSQNSGVLLRELPFCCSDHNLPSHAENTGSVSGDDLPKLLKASSSLGPPFERLVAEELAGEDGAFPICIIGDVFCGWTVHIAQKLGIFHATFSTCGAFGTAVYISMWLHLPHLKESSGEEEFAVPGFPESFRLRRSQLPRSLTSVQSPSPAHSFMIEHLTLSMSSQAMLCNTVEDLEPAGAAALRKIVGLRVWSVWTDSCCRQAETTCTRWLDAHPARSVLYVSFGSQNSFSAAQMMALAAGLEAAERPFIWVVRPPVGFDVKGEFRDKWLPEGFEERMCRSGRGLLVRNWAPQLEILSHGSVGGFLSHCGWNSAMESLSRGVPLISWPMAAEQFYNSRLVVEELGAGLEVGRDAEGRVSSAEVQRMVREAMGGDKGKEMRKKAAGVAKTIMAALHEKGSSIVALGDFLAAVLKAAPPEN